MGSAERKGTGGRRKRDIGRRKEDPSDIPKVRTKRPCSWVPGGTVLESAKFPPPKRARIETQTWDRRNSPNPRPCRFRFLCGMPHPLAPRRQEETRSKSPASPASTVKPGRRTNVSKQARNRKSEKSSKIPARTPIKVTILHGGGKNRPTPFPKLGGPYPPDVRHPPVTSQTPRFSHPCPDTQNFNLNQTQSWPPPFAN